LARQKYHAGAKWTQIEIFLGQCQHEYKGKMIEESVQDFHVDLTKDFVVFMRRCGEIFKIKLSKLKKAEEKTDVQATKVSLPVQDFYKDKSERDEIGLKWMFLHNIV